MEAFQKSPGMLGLLQRGINGSFKQGDLFGTSVITHNAWCKQTYSGLSRWGFPLRKLRLSLFGCSLHFLLLFLLPLPVLIAGGKLHQSRHPWVVPMDFVEVDTPSLLGLKFPATIISETDITRHQAQEG